LLTGDIIITFNLNLDTTDICGINLQRQHAVENLLTGLKDNIGAKVILLADRDGLILCSTSKKEIYGEYLALISLKLYSELSNLQNIMKKFNSGDALESIVIRLGNHAFYITEINNEIKLIAIVERK